jgi:hypothetical protein
MVDSMRLLTRAQYLTLEMSLMHYSNEYQHAAAKIYSKPLAKRKEYDIKWLAYCETQRANADRVLEILRGGNRKVWVEA